MLASVFLGLLAASFPAGALTLEPPKKNSAEPLDAIDEYVLGEMAKKHVPGLALGIYRAGSILKTEGYGWANVETKEPVRPNTVFQIQSVTKSFTASAIMLLIDEGKLGLEDRITKYISGCPESWSNITVRHLLTHTSGIKDFINEPTVPLDQDITAEAVVASLVQRPLNFAPGEKYTYSNTGYHLLGMIIHQVTGKPWEEVLRERIFRPLAMKDTDINSATCALPRRAAGYIWADGGLQPGMYVALSILGYAGGGILSTVNDLALWDAGLYSGKILKQSLLDQMWTPARFNNGSLSTYGFGWGVKDFRGHRLVAHSGAHATGFRSTFLRFPDDQVTVVVLVNERGANPDDFGLWIAGRYIPGLRSSAPPAQSAPSARADTGR